MGKRYTAVSGGNGYPTLTVRGNTPKRCPAPQLDHTITWSWSWRDILQVARLHCSRRSDYFANVERGAER
jgi:hypothetical protein